MHLLQAILNFHLARFDKAKLLLEQAERELKYLRVDEKKVLILAELGYTMGDARLALRVSHGEIIPAESYLSRKKEQKLSLLKKEGDKRNNLVQMGFHPRKVSKALAKFSGNFQEALIYLLEHKKSSPSSSSASGSSSNLPSTSSEEILTAAKDLMNLAGMFFFI